MKFCSPRAAGVLLCLLTIATFAACSSDPDTHTPDTGENIEPGPDTGEPDTSEPDTGEPDTGEPDTGEPDDEGLVLQGHLAPSGGMSMSNSFTLSGELAPNMPGTSSSSSSFVLEQTPPILIVKDSDE